MKIQKRGGYESAGKKSVPRHRVLSRKSADRLERALEKKQRARSKKAVVESLKDRE